MRMTTIRGWFHGMMAVCLCALNAAAGTKKVGDTWVMENKALMVTVKEDTAHMTVLDKATGVVWAQEDPTKRCASDEKVKIRRAATPPTLDGSSEDWPGNDIVWLPWVGKDGEKNLSGGARFMWDDTNVYLYVRVRDNQRAFGNESATAWWEADSIEFWIDSVQVGLHLYPGKEVAANGKGEAFSGTRMAVKLIDEDHLPGYAVELAMPIAHFPILKDPEAGARIYVAIGLNDADPKPGEPTKRCAQGYYPKTWVHSVPSTFAVAVLTDAEGNAPAMTKKNNRTTGSAGGAVADMRKGHGSNALSYSLTLTRGQVRPLALEVELKLLGNEPAMDVALDCPAGNDTPMKKFQYPAPLFPPKPETYFMAMTNYCDGRYVPVGDKSFRNKRLVSYGGDMPWVTVTDGTQGMMTVAMTPCDSYVQMQSRTDDKELRLGFPGFGWFESKGTFGGKRVGRYVFYDKGAHVKACKIYREIAKEQGLVRKLTTDAKKNPDVLKLMGAVNWWGGHGLAFVREASAAGMKHGLLNGRPSPSDMEEIKKLGWLVGEYDNYEDIDDAPTIVSRSKVPVKDHAVVKADGEFMTAWVTRDKDMNPIHTYMKQCTGMMTKSARICIPKILETYPYNARFIDVTPSTSFKECYSPVHPCNRCEDLVNRQNLIKYVSRDLGLVTGGEHGRWWAVPFIHYHEGMMGGAMYSWPAGYLRDVEKREDISERYLTYGINPANRAPLFELVFHDCVVNYWYWGATNDYLHQVMPELTDRKTAMNVLYGTPPMMWVNNHGLHWRVPEERELMLTIYRNVCKLHEVIGPQEMVSHAFLTDDRMVQRTTFEDSTGATVNFSTTPFEVATGDGAKSLTLLENDFYVHGPAVEQWRVTASDGTPRQTYIRTDEYLFADSGSSTFQARGITSTGQVNLIVETENRARILLGEGSSLNLDVLAWQPSWKGPRALVTISPSGEPLERVPNGGADTLSLRGPAEGNATYILYAGKEARQPDVTVEALDLTVNGKRIDAAAVLPNDALLTATVTIRNLGLAKAKGLTVAIHLDGPDGPVLESKRIRSLKPGATCTVPTAFPVAMADGPRCIVAVVTAKRDVALTGRTTVSAPFTGPCDPSAFPVRCSYTLQLPQGDCAGMAVEVPFDVARTDGTKVDSGNIRIRFGNGQVVPAQFEATAPGSMEGNLVFCVPEGVTPGSTVSVQALGVAEGSTQVYSHAGRYTVTPDGATIDMGTYSASILKGTLSSISLRTDDGPALAVASEIIVSSKETGYGSETGTVESFACKQQGSVRSVFTCTKLLRDKYRLTRTWYFYPDRIEVHSTCDPKVHTLTRAMYLREATATNDSGKTVKMDGSGNGEDFGFKGKPGWYAVYSDEYRNACIALSDCGGFTYWDGGRLGQISLNAGDDPVEKRVYIWGPGAKNADFAKAAAAAYAQGIKVK